MDNQEDKKMNWIENILSRFNRVRRLQRESTWIAECPAHEDKTPSLGLWLGRKGQMIIRDWAQPGCTIHSILTAVGLKMNDLFPDDDDKEEIARQSQKKPYNFKTDSVKRKIVETYPYTDEQNNLLYEVVRFEPKSFCQRRPDDRSADGWRWILGDVRRVLYNLPEIVRTAMFDWPVLILEGEKDCNRISTMLMNLVATTNPGGTGMGWRDEYSRSLCGRHCTIIPDNDTSGMKHAQRVCGSLILAGVQSVRIVELPGLPPGGDLSDWFGSGHSFTELVEMIKCYSRWVPENRRPS